MKHRALLIPLIIVFQLALNTLISAAWIMPSNAQTIPNGITVDGKAIGGMTRSQAAAYLENENSHKLINRTIILQDGRKQWVLTTREFNFHYDYAQTVDNALSDIQWANSSARVVNAMKLQARTLNIPLQAAWDEQKLASFLSSINEEITIPARDATVEYHKGRFVVVEERAGIGLDVKSCTDQIIQMVLSDKGGTLNVAKKALAPKTTSRDLSVVNCELASSSSQLTDQANRSNNIALAARAMNGAVVKPGEIFSFNRQVGRRTLEKGYKSAPVIVDDNLKNDLGGGVCQAASTLYNAASRAGLEIVEHAGHSVPLKHVSGKDTTVYYDLIDLKFKNNLDHPVVINSQVDDNTLTIRLLGSSTDKK